MGNKVNKIYVGDKQAYPVVYCDFTKSDYGFTWLGSNGNASEIPSHGRNSGGLYMYYNDSGNNNKIGAWKIPSSVYSQGAIKKIELTLYSTTAENGGGIGNATADYDIYTMRTWRNTIEQNYNGDNHQISVVNPGNTEYKLNIDFEKSIISNGYSTTMQANLKSRVTTNFSLGNCALVIMRTKNTGTSYIRKAVFYF